MKNTLELFLDLYRSITAIHYVEETEENYVKQGKAFFYMPGRGHEGSIALNPFLTPQDYLACHYRDKALMLARGAKPSDFFKTMLCTADSDSHGRQMSAFLHNRKLNILSLSGPVANAALHACGIAAELSREAHEKHPIVYCGLGDGMTQEGEFYEAALCAMQQNLPVLFVIQDNGYAISTTTKGKTFFSTAQGDESSFCGIPIERIEGFDIIKSYEAFSMITERMRNRAKDKSGIVPAIVVMKTERLSSHTNADDQTVYRSPEELEYARNHFDPLMIFEKKLIEMGVSQNDLETIKNEAKSRVEKDLQEASRSAEPEPCFDAKMPVDFDAVAKKTITKSTQAEEKYTQKNDFTMNEAINAVFFNRLATDERVTLFGEDIEDPKGDVFGVTRGLSTAFPGRVCNSPLAEASIAGMSVGRAMVGGKPVAFFQFADFMPPAMNQLFSEVGNMYWRTAGTWQVPVIFMVSCGAYRPGLGPFHASTLESMVLQIPGIDVFMPSTAENAAHLLNTAFESNRPTVFFYPKNCLNDRALSASPEALYHAMNPLQAQKIAVGTDITLVGWGNTVSLIKQAATILEKNGKSVEIIDLPALSPWDKDGVIQSVKKTSRLLVVQENNVSCSFSSEVAAVVSEFFSQHAKTQHVLIRRLSRGDTYVPFHYGNQLTVLPSVTSVVETATEMLGGTLTWIEKASQAESADTIIPVSGTSPSDEVIVVIEWLVSAGDTIKQGDIIAHMEADKAAFEFASPVGGKIAKIFLSEGDSAGIGEALFSVEKNESTTHALALTREIVKEASIVWEKSSDDDAKKHTPAQCDDSKGKEQSSQSAVIGIAGIASAIASKKVSSEELEQQNGWENLAKKNGIQNRYWADDGEDTVTLGFAAAQKLLKKLQLSVTDIDAVICATGSPVYMNPSVACCVLEKLSRAENTQSDASAFDFSAACAGYIYGLKIARSFVYENPGAKVLLLTSEVLSGQLDKTDISTAPIFGDAATASIICSSDTLKLEVSMLKPNISSVAEDGSLLRIPRNEATPIFMNGPAIFLAAIREMGASLAGICGEYNIDLKSLDLIVPHQANQRIINALRQKLHLKEEQVFSNIADFGNTSSSTIPIALEQIFEQNIHGTIGLCAFGAGFTVGSCILRRT